MKTSDAKAKLQMRPITDDDVERVYAKFRDFPSASSYAAMRAALEQFAAPLHARIAELEAELDAKHAKLVEVADNLRATRAQLAQRADSGAEVTRLDCESLKKAVFQDERLNERDLTEPMDRFPYTAAALRTLLASAARHGAAQQPAFASLVGLADEMDNDVASRQEASVAHYARVLRDRLVATPAPEQQPAAFAFTAEESLTLSRLRTDAKSGVSDREASLILGLVNRLLAHSAHRAQPAAGWTEADYAAAREAHRLARRGSFADGVEAALDAVAYRLTAPAARAAALAVIAVAEQAFGELAARPEHAPLVDVHAFVMRRLRAEGGDRGGLR